MAYVVGDSCVMCGACTAACPMGAIEMGDTQAHIDPNACVSCGTCADTCPMGAISEE